MRCGYYRCGGRGVWEWNRVWEWKQPIEKDVSGVGLKCEKASVMSKRREVVERFCKRQKKFQPQPHSHFEKKWRPKACR